MVHMGCSGAGHMGPGVRGSVPGKDPNDSAEQAVGSAEQAAGSAEQVVGSADAGCMGMAAEADAGAECRGKMAAGSAAEGTVAVGSAGRGCMGCTDERGTSHDG